MYTEVLLSSGNNYKDQWINEVTHSTNYENAALFEIIFPLR